MGRSGRASLPRSAGAGAHITAFRRRGAWGISPHVIPHRILHAVSGTISLVLQIHGPNFGVDGMPSDSGQLIATALATLSTGQVPGIWAVMTGWAPEPIPARQGAAANDRSEQQPVCGAVAFALTPVTTEWTGPQLHVQPTSHTHGLNGAAKPNSVPSRLFNLERLLEALDSPDGEPTGGRWDLSWGAQLIWSASRKAAGL